MANTNVLEGIICPECGNEEDFVIEITTLFVVSDDGVGDQTGDNEWGPDSYIQCPKCMHDGKVGGFTVEV